MLCDVPGPEERSSVINRTGRRRDSAHFYTTYVLQYKWETLTCSSKVYTDEDIMIRRVLRTKM